MAKYFPYEKKEKLGLEVFGGCMLIVLLLLVICFLYAAIGMWLWNAILVPMFAFPVVGYWQMYGIMILAKLIFGGSSYSSRGK